MGFPRARANETRAKPVRLPELEADVLDRLAQPGRRHVLAPHLLDALIVLGERIGARRRNPAQRGAVAAASLVHQSLPLAGRGTWREMQGVVNDRQVVLVMEEARVRVDFRVDADPELHVPLELRRARHGGLGGEPARHCEPGEQPAQQPADGSARGLCCPCRVHLHSGWSTILPFIQGLRQSRATRRRWFATNVSMFLTLQCR